MNFDKNQTEESMRRLVRFMLRYKKKWAAAGLMLVLGAGSAAGAYFYVPNNVQPVLASEDSPAVPDSEWETETTARIVMETTAAGGVEAYSRRTEPGPFFSGGGRPE